MDVVEWSDEIPLKLVKDARQLRHLIVKNGAVVEEVVKNGKMNDSEIGLGGYLIDSSGNSTMGRSLWFLANRTAFGIKEDGNLIFAMGHHVSTRDLGKALVLAGCKRAIHGDANIHNIVCNFYYRDDRNKVISRERLSPEQLKYHLEPIRQRIREGLLRFLREIIEQTRFAGRWNLFSDRFGSLPLGEGYCATAPQRHQSHPSYQLPCPGFWGTTNHESPRLRPTLRGFASEMGSKSATLRHPAEGRLISPPHLPIRTPDDGCFMPTPFIGVRLQSVNFAGEQLSQENWMRMNASNRNLCSVVSICGCSLLRDPAHLQNPP